jgi:hypothetical protein
LGNEIIHPRPDVGVRVCDGASAAYAEIAVDDRGFRDARDAEGEAKECREGQVGQFHRRGFLGLNFSPSSKGRLHRVGGNNTSP